MNKESIWTLKGEFGVISRVTKFHGNITEWIEGKRITGAFKGINEPVNGYATVSLRENEEGEGAVISGEMEFEISGVLGALIGRFMEPWIRSAAEDLVIRIVEAIQSRRAQGEAASTKCQI